VSEDVPNLKGSGLTGDMPLEVCVPPPLGVGPGGSDPCGDNAPRFHHLDNFPFGIASHNGMWLAIGMYNKHYTWATDTGPDGGGWAKWARFNATKYFIMITDDDAYVPGTNEGDPSIIGNATEPYEVFDRLILKDPRNGNESQVRVQRGLWMDVSRWRIDERSGGGRLSDGRGRSESQLRDGSWDSASEACSAYRWHRGIHLSFRLVRGAWKTGG